MQDRTSWSYRANLPGGNPDMYKEGGKARDAFKEARASPYVREQAGKLTQQSSEGTSGGQRQGFKSKRRKARPAPRPRGGPSL